MDVGHPRKQLAEVLKARLPKSWRIIPEQRSFDDVGKTTVVIKQTTISKLPAAPIGMRSVAFTLTLVSRFTSIAAAEDDLDELVPDLLDHLEALGIKWSTATKVAVDENYLGYDITVEINTKKENL